MNATYPDLLRSKVIHSSDGFVQIEVTDRVALILKNLKRPGKDGAMIRIQCIYLGFASEELARGYATFLKSKLYSFTPRLIVRERERTGFSNSHEIKLWGVAGREAELMQLIYSCANASAKFPL